MIEKGYCQLTGHKGYEILEICIRRNCNQQTRWICQICTDQGIHKHKQSKSKTLNLNDFRQRVLTPSQQRFQEGANLIYSFYTKYLNEIQQLMNKLQFQIINEENQPMEVLKNFQDNPFSLSNKQLYSLMAFQKDIINNYNLVSRNLEFVVSQLRQLLNKLHSMIWELKNENETLQCIQREVKNLQKQKSYQPIVKGLIKFKSFGARISPNESHLVYCNENGQLQLNHPLSCKKLGTINQENKVHLVSFTLNSKQLIMCQPEAIKFYRMGMICKLQSKIKLNNQTEITKLIQIDSNQILIKVKQSKIIIADIVNHRQKLKLEFDFNCALEIDYDSQRQEIIICYKNQICFYSIHGKLLFILQLEDKKLIEQMQKIQNSNKILIYYDNSVRMITVDYESQNFNTFHESGLTSYHNFQLLCNYSLIAIVAQTAIYILDDDLNIIQLIPFSEELKEYFRRGIQQQGSLGSIILQGDSIYQKYIRDSRNNKNVTSKMKYHKNTLNQNKDIKICNYQFFSIQKISKKQKVQLPDSQALIYISTTIKVLVVNYCLMILSYYVASAYKCNPCDYLRLCFDSNHQFYIFLERKSEQNISKSDDLTLTKNYKSLFNHSQEFCNHNTWLEIYENLASISHIIKKAYNNIQILYQKMIAQKYCQLKGHEQKEVIQICLYQECGQFTRWMCLLCNQNQIHNHRLRTSHHIQEIPIFNNNVITNNYSIFKEKSKGIDLIYMKYLKEIEQIICQLQFQLINNKIEEQAFIKFQENPFSLNKKELDSLVNFEQDIIDGYSNLVRKLESVASQCREQIARLNQIIYSFRKYETYKTVECIQQQVATYQRQKTYQSVDQFQIRQNSFGARVSPNEKKLVFCNERGQLQLNHTYRCTSIGTLQLQLQREIDLVTFSKNSNLIILQQWRALKIFRLGRICKLQRSLRLNHIDQINSLIFIDSNLILIKNNKSTIIIYDILDHRLHLKLELDFFSGMDYDYQRQQIILYLHDKICIYSIQGKLSFNCKFQSYVSQLQKIQNSDNILIYESSTLNLMKVDYELQKLIVIKQFSIRIDTHFSLLCNNQLIALVSSYVIYILDVNLIKIQLIPFQNPCSNVQKSGKQQKDATNFLILQGENTLELIRLSDLK